MDELSLICCAYVCSVLHNHHEHPGGIEVRRPLFQTSVKQLCATLEELPTNFASEPKNQRLGLASYYQQPIYLVFPAEKAHYQRFKSQITVNNQYYQQR